MRKSIVIAAVALAAIAAGFPFSAARADTPCGGAVEQARQAYRIGLQHFDQEIATQETRVEENLETLRDMHNPLADRFLEDFESATTFEGRHGAIGDFQRRVNDLENSGAGAFMPEQAKSDLDKAAQIRWNLIVFESFLQSLRKERAAIKGVVDGFENSASGASSQGSCVPGYPNSDDPRVALEQQQNQFELVHLSRTALVTAFTPVFLARRQEFLAELPATTRGNLENGGGTDWAGRASVTYTAMKIYIALQTAQDQGREIPGALAALNNLYRQMSSYQSAVLETEVQIAQVQKKIAHTIVDERAYAMGGGDGGGGGGGEGGNGGGN